MSDHHDTSGDLRALAKALDTHVICTTCERDDALTSHAGDVRAWCHRCARLTGPVDLVVHHGGGTWAECAAEAEQLVPGILELAGIELDDDHVPDRDAVALADRGREAAVRMADAVPPHVARYLRTRGLLPSGAGGIEYRYVPRWDAKEMDGRIPKGHELREVALASGCWTADPELGPDRVRWQLGHDRILVAWRDRRGRVRGIRSRAFKAPQLSPEEEAAAAGIVEHLELVPTPETDAEADKDSELAPPPRWLGPRAAEGAALIWHHHAPGDLVVAEGVLDFAAVIPCGVRCATTLGAQPSEVAVRELCDLVQPGDDVVLMPDLDHAGRTWTRRLAVALTEAGAKVSVVALPDHIKGVPVKDLADVLAVDAVPDRDPDLRVQAWRMAVLLEHAKVPAWAHLVRLVPADTPGHSVVAVAREVQLIDLLALEPDSVEGAVQALVAHVAEEIPGVELTRLRKEIAAKAKDDGPIPEGVGPLTDSGNAERLAARVRGHLLWVHELQEWFLYSEVLGIWVRDQEGARYRLALESTRALGQHDHKAVAAWGKSSESRRRLDDALVLLRTVPGMSCSASSLDLDPYLLCCRSGVIDLRTGALREHGSGYRMTRRAKADYRPDAVHEEWDGLVRWAMGHDEETVEYLQRALGCACTGLVVEELMHAHIGPGANGKSTVLGAIERVLGDYAVRAAPGLLTSSGAAGHPTAIRDLRGARLAVVAETDEGEHLLADRVKQLTDRYSVLGRGMCKDWERFRPSAKLHLVTNHPPVVKSADGGTWRRIRRIEWSQTVADEDKDTELPERLDTDDARAAILAWLARGAKVYLERGLGVAPERVLAATGAYRQESDVLGEWLAACCELHPAAEETASSLFASHEAWCLREGKQAATKNALGRRLKDLGVGTRHTSRGNVRTGIRLRIETAADLPENVFEIFRSSEPDDLGAEQRDDNGIDVDAILETMMDD